MKLRISSNKQNKQNNILQTVISHLFSIFPITKYQIIGESMVPTLNPGDEVLVNKKAYIHRRPKIGDIVVAKSPQDNKVLIKRITKINQEKYFLRGDNEKASTDSRKFGMLEKINILGKVIYQNKKTC